MKTIRHTPRRATEKSAAEIRNDMALLKSMAERDQQVDAVEKYIIESRRYSIIAKASFAASGAIVVLLGIMLWEILPDIPKAIFAIIISLVSLAIIISAFHFASTNDPES